MIGTRKNTGNPLLDSRQNWPIVGLLLVMLAIPAVPAMFLLSFVVINMTTGADLPQWISPVYRETSAAVLVHGAAGIVFFVTVPAQFSDYWRSRKPKYHRLAGKVALISGCILALSGIWMHHTLHPSEFGNRYASLITVALGMCIAFLLAFTSIAQGGVRSHQKWMYRAMAITLGQVTQIFLEIIPYLLWNPHSQAFKMLLALHYDFGVVLGGIINLVFVEIVLYRQERRYALTGDVDIRKKVHF